MIQKRFIAEVIDNNDSEQKGRVQVFVEYIMENWEKDHLPWAFPDTDFQSFIPEIGDKVWIWFEEEDYFKNPFYTHKVQFHNSNDANKSIGSIEGSYPNIKYWWLPNGVAIAMNSGEAELSITNGSSEIFINADNEIKVTSSTGAEITTDSSGKISIKNSSYDLKTALDAILDGIVAITVPTPVGPSGTPLNAATFTSIKTQLANLLV